MRKGEKRGRDRKAEKVRQDANMVKGKAIDNWGLMGHDTKGPR